MTFDAHPPFIPLWGLGNRHLQTVVGSRLRGRDGRLEARSQRRVFDTGNGTHVVALHTPAAGRPLGDVPVGKNAIVLVHGLAGSATSVYMLGLAGKAVMAGHDALRVNMRNCGGSEQLTPTLYHAGLTHDLDAIIKELIVRDGVERIAVCGFSLGGNIVLRWAGDAGDDLPPQVYALASVSPAIDLAASSHRVDTKTSSRLYRDMLLGLLRDTASAKRKLADEGAVTLHPDLAAAYDAVGDIDALATIREFDDRLIAPSFGFDGADDYYARASAAPVLHRIRVPTIIVHSRDDPLVPPELIESDIVRDAPRVSAVITDRGGHCAFLARRPAPGHLDRYWAENVVLDFFEAASAGDAHEHDE